ncbi:MAG: recombinase family protein [Candidatus Pacebacteria bacterium]|nr:recombinase family protein [Candidatus Paceibacterota bacterium]
MKPENKKIKYILYARKSSESEDRQVASIQSQIDVLKDIAKQEGLEIIDILSESKSAKAPERQVFNQMLQKINNNEAQGIICWKLDRLARNPVDGGNISWMLQRGILKHIKTFERSYYPTDNVLMMSVEFGMANQYILDLSLNTKRGLKAKAEKGIFPAPAPLGYINIHNRGNKTIVPDPERFNLMRKMFDLMLTGSYAPPQIAKTANEEWGFKMPNGKEMSRSTAYNIFTKPFYYGDFEYPKGSNVWYKGIHKKLITAEEYDKIQIILGRKGKPRPRTHIFAFTGLIRCGECGALITAEEKTKIQKNGNIHEYTYYHCTKKPNPNCSQKCIRKEDLEKQVLAVLDKIEIPQSFHQWALDELKKDSAKDSDNIKKITENKQKEYNDCLKKFDAIIEMRADGELTQDEFMAKKESLAKEKAKLYEILTDTDKRADEWIGKAEKVFSFARDAKTNFENGTLQQKREILSALGSNLLLKDKILTISIQKPFVLIEKMANEVKAIHSRLEPVIIYQNEFNFGQEYAQSLALLRG